MEDSSNRRELLEVLDRLVSYEHYYHSVYGHFTEILSHVGFRIPDALSGIYEIRVAEARADRLIVNAFSEADGRVADLVSIDQDFHVHANFELPMPRASYLRAIALRHLRAMRDAPSDTRELPENSLFQGYFRYEARDASGGAGPVSKAVFAVGLRSPVIGAQLELGASDDDSLLAEDYENTLNDELAGGAAAASGTGESALPESHRTGQVPTNNVMNTLEEAYLAQRIFHGEMGRYARNWSELTRVAHFKFEGHDQNPADAVPFSDGAPPPEMWSAPQRVPSSEMSGGLVLEPLDSPQVFQRNTDK